MFLFQVYAIEASDMCTGCERIVKQNNYKDKITVIYGQVEDVKIEGLTHVDIIISEWMGFYLLHESMLTSLINARERWLSPYGIMIPSQASIYTCPVTMQDVHKESFEFWKDVEGFDMSPLIPIAEADVFSRPVISIIKSEHCLSTPQCVALFDLGYVQMEDIASITSENKFIFEKDGVLDGMAFWFSVSFQKEDDELCKVVTLSTSPDSKPTHWKQTTVLLPQRTEVQKGQELPCQLQLDQDEENHRHYNIGLQLSDDYCVVDEFQETIKEHLLYALKKNNKQDENNDTQ